MNTTHDPLAGLSPDLLDGLSADVADRVARYTPTTLSAGRWRECRPPVIALVAAADPSTPEDAKSLLATLCKFLSVIGPADRSWDLERLLSEANVAAYWHARRCEGVTRKTLENHRGRLNRLMAVKRGLAVPTRQPRRRLPGPPPYTDAELTALASAARGLSEEAGATAGWALALGLAAGVVAPAVYGVHVRRVTGDRAVAVLGDGRQAVLAGPWAQGLRVGIPAPVSRRRWECARSSLNRRQDGPRLRADRLRMTWLVDCLGQHAALGELMTDIDATPGELDAVVAHLPPPRVSSLAALRHC